jgi:hypothetical protein
MLGLCHSIGCTNQIEDSTDDFCDQCKAYDSFTPLTKPETCEAPKESLSKKYPKYYKSVGDLTEIDVYAVHKLFNINDPSGALQHASKKLLLSGVRTGGKTQYDDIREARDTLTRWMELHSPAIFEGIS